MNKEAIELLNEAKIRFGDSTNRLIDQALAILTEQPPAGECFPLTCKVMYEVIQECCGLCPWCVGVLGRYVKQESDRIDRSEASRKELLTACENLKKIYIEGSGNTSWMANYSDMDAAIKAEKEVKK